MDSTEVLTPLPPPRVWVGASTYELIPCAAEAKELEGARAITEFDPSRIHYDATRPSREVFELVIRELTHALNHEYELEPRGRKRLNRERVATVHARGWSQVLLDNPALVEWLDTITTFIKSEQEHSE